MTQMAARKARLLLASSLLAIGVHQGAHAETSRAPSLNGYGVSGLIDMPSGEMQPDGYLTMSTAHWGPISRTTLSFQISPRMSASFRFLGIRDWSDCLPAQAAAPLAPITTAPSTSAISC